MALYWKVYNNGDNYSDRHVSIDYQPSQSIIDQFLEIEHNLVWICTRACID